MGIFFKNPERKVNTLTLKQKISEIDLFGAFFLICAIVCLLLALQWGGSTYPWRDSRVWGTLLGFSLLLVSFLAIQVARGDRATIPPRIFRQRSVLASSCFSLFLLMGIYTSVAPILSQTRLRPLTR